MPEYLSPGVYVEEVNTGSKPIEGVSTSTAGAVGICERGPENVPILVTSPGDFNRVFGGQLTFGEFTDPQGRCHAYLPYGVEGFFTNGGRRLYLVRAVPPDAARAGRELFDRGTVGDGDTVLLQAAARGTGTSLLGPPLYVLELGAIADGDFVRIGDGSRAEYRAIANVDAADLVALTAPLENAHSAATPELFPVVPLGTPLATFTLNGDETAGTTTIEIVETVPGQADVLRALTRVVLQIGPPESAEYVIATSPAGPAGPSVEFTVTLALDHEDDEDVVVVGQHAATPVALAFDAAAGQALLAVASGDVAALPAGRIVLFSDGAAVSEVQRIGALGRLELGTGAYATYPDDTVVQLVTVDRIAEVDDPGATATASVFPVDDSSELEIGMNIEAGGAPGESRTIQAIDESVTPRIVTLLSALGAVPADGIEIIPVTALSAAAAAGSIVVSLANRLGLDADDVIRFGDATAGAPDEEFATIAQVVGPRGVAPDAGTVILTAPLRLAHATGSRVAHQVTPAADTSREPTELVVPAAAGATRLHVRDGSNYAEDELVSVTLSSGAVFYHRLAADADTSLSASAIQLTDPLEMTHELAAAVVERDALLEIHALDRGGWGNRLLVSVEDEESGLASQAEILGVNSALELQVNTLTGMERGTLLEPFDPATGATVGAFLKVRDVNRTNRLLTLDPPGLIGALPPGTRLRSREFRLSVFLLRRPDPAVPSRDDLLEDTEVFRHLSMDIRHSRYVQRILGTTWDPAFEVDDDGNPLRLWDQRSTGASSYVRVRDTAPDRATAESLRLGPETLVDVLPSGRPRAARHRLAGGTDAIGTLTTTSADGMYIGADNAEPRLRTGIFALGNIPDISLVAVAGQTTVAIQQALIDHCELSRYRFAVLDAQGPPADTLADVQAQRQNFDTKYAALYHPWLTIRDPLPDNPSDVRDLALPPSLHTLGVYARTDIERGVHKAPANEVVRGITGLKRALNKGEHDILNPFPKNINVIRDFRPDNRGIRIWGARVITSDSDYKYVNVRRLLIFIEASIDRGLQWAVFEPNAEDLWARVRRAVTNFLTVVWRNGALEGVTPEQAFFVKCDRTTMTQPDIDNGRLICVIGVAPVKPAEFVIVRIGLWTANSQQ